MAETVICRVIAKTTGGVADSVSMLDIYSHSGAAPRRLAICQSQTLKLSYGDRIKCVSGTVAVVINPGTPAGSFILYANLPSGAAWNQRTELEMNDETTKNIHRGKISVANDIGATNTAAGGFTR